MALRRASGDGEPAFGSTTEKHKQIDDHVFLQEWYVLLPSRGWNGTGVSLPFCPSRCHSRCGQRVSVRQPGKSRDHWPALLTKLSGESGEMPTGSGRAEVGREVRRARFGEHDQKTQKGRPSYGTVG